AIDMQYDLVGKRDRGIGRDLALFRADGSKRRAADAELVAQHVVKKHRGMFEPVTAARCRVDFVLKNFLETARHKSGRLHAVTPLILVEQNGQRVSWFEPRELRMMHQHVDEAAGKIAAERPTPGADLDSPHRDAFVPCRLLSIDLVR